MPDDFDEVLYLKANPDVRVMVARGVVSSALDHWRSQGADEHARGKRRSGFYAYDIEYDEETYLRSNEDVAAAVRAGVVRDGYEHWIRFGRRECAEGRRVGCFGGASLGVRPFRIPLGASGELLVATATRHFSTVEQAQCRLADGSSLSLDPASIACTPEVEIVDRTGRATLERFLLLWVPAELSTARLARLMTLDLTTTAGEPRTFSSSLGDVGDQRPTFTSIDAANDFVLAAKALFGADSRASVLVAEVGALVHSLLVTKPPLDDEPYSNVHAEHAVRVEGVGVYVCGWLVPASSSLERCRVWCPDTGECVEVQRSLVRTRRVDVWEAFKERLEGPSGYSFGFVVLLSLPEASRLRECRLVFGLTPEGGSERVSDPVRVKSRQSFTDAAKIILASLDPASPVFEPMMAEAIAPAIEALWATERACKARTVVVREFGERARKPSATVVVPIYGRYDFIKYQLALFANDDDFRSGAVELIYFIDDPRLIEDVLQSCIGLEPLYRVPLVVAYTGDNHGFSGANNLGASLARGDLLVLLNSDVMPKRSGWVTRLVRAHESLPGCGVLGAKLLYFDESLQHDGMIFERFPFWNGLFGNNHPGKGLPNRSEPDAPPREVEAVTGACVAISRSLYDELGGLCEEFVLGDFEDSELCIRVRNSGRRVYYLPDVELYHLERQSLPLLPDGGDWRWQLTVFNCWLQNRKWRTNMETLTRSAIAGGWRGGSR